jgi:hypothetical protein
MSDGPTTSIETAANSPKEKRRTQSPDDLAVCRVGLTSGLSLGRDGVRGRVRAGKLARSSDAAGEVSGSATPLELRRPGRSDPLLERREVLNVQWVGRRADLSALAFGHARHLQRIGVVPERCKRISDANRSNVGCIKSPSANASSSERTYGSSASAGRPSRIARSPR